MAGIDGWANDWLNHGKYRVQEGSNGYCLKREFGYYGQGFEDLTIHRFEVLDSIESIPHAILMLWVPTRDSLLGTP